MSRRSAFRALTGSAVLAAGALLAAACGPASVPGAATPSSVPASGVLRGPAPAPYFTGLAFPDAADGWLLGEPGADVAGTGSASAEIWHTATGGATWQEQWHGPGSPRSVSATDAGHAWALITCPPGGGHVSCQPELLATADSGQHWQAAAVMPREVDQVQFVTDRFGIATVDGCLSDVNASRCQGQVLVSHDGGATWTAVLATHGPVFAAADAAGPVWAAETKPGSSGQPGLLGSGVTFLTSTDGGRSWQQLGRAVSVPVTAQIDIRLAVGPAGLAWASLFDGGSCAMHGCGVAELLHSTDGGRTWSAAPLTSGASGCGWGSLTYSAAPDGTVLAASGVPGGACAPPFGFLFRYGPSGWQRLPSWPLTGAIALSVVSQDVAYAITQGAVVRTGDGGRYWTQLLPAPAPAGQVAAVSATTALGDQDTVGAAEAGAVLRTEDGGRSWQQVADLPGIVTWLDFPSAAGGIAVTYQAGPEPVWGLWTSRDLGSRWSLAGRLPGRRRRQRRGLRAVDVRGRARPAAGRGRNRAMAGAEQRRLRPGPDLDDERLGNDVDRGRPAAARWRHAAGAGQLRLRSRIGRRPGAGAGRRAGRMDRLAGRLHRGRPARDGGHARYGPGSAERPGRQRHPADRPPYRVHLGDLGPGSRRHHHAVPDHGWRSRLAAGPGPARAARGLGGRHPAGLHRRDPRLARGRGGDLAHRRRRPHLDARIARRPPASSGTPTRVPWPAA